MVEGGEGGGGEGTPLYNPQTIKIGRQGEAGNAIDSISNVKGSGCGEGKLKEPRRSGSKRPWNHTLSYRGDIGKKREVS